MPTVYRIKHLPSGMYFCPSRNVKVRLGDEYPYYAEHGRRIKSNLSKDGKIYARKPNIKQIGTHYYTHLITSTKQLMQGACNYCMLPVLEQEWIIEEIA